MTRKGRLDGDAEGGATKPAKHHSSKTANQELRYGADLPGKQGKKEAGPWP
jgi:hypothetical protein